MSRILRFSFLPAVLLVFTLILWVMFLPIQFGGVSAYVIVNGNSMLPLYQKGDLVITRRETAYAVGDIVTYHNKELKAPVIHRIIAEKNGAFVMKGDHNPWQDLTQPTPGDIIGKAWLHFPGLGNLLMPTQSPLGITLLSAAAIFILLSMFIAQEKGLRFRRRKLLSGDRPVPISIKFMKGGVSMRKLGSQIETILFIFLALFIGSLVLAVLAFSNPETISTPADIQLVNVGLFSYTAVTPSGVYDSNGPKTGDPIFLKTTCNVNMHFGYVLNGNPLSDVKGTISLTAESRAPNGWTRSFPLKPAAKFTGNAADIQADLNPCQILSTLHSAEDQIQIHNDSYQLALVPQVKVSATAGLLPMQSTFAPRLIFYLDNNQMYVVNDNGGQDPLSPFKVESKVATADAPNKIQLPGFSLNVHIARVLALVGLIASLGLGLFVGWNIYKAARQDPVLAASLRYGSLLVNVSQMPVRLSEREILVESVDDLALLAERNATAILHVVQEDGDDFLVEGNNVVYRVRLPRGRS
jgi:signal peptidase I